MDLVGYARSRFEEIRDEFTGFAERLEVHDLTCIPISAPARRQRRRPLGRDALVRADPRCSHHLEDVHIASDRNLIDLRFPVQLVIRPISSEHHDFRGYAGTVASGVLEVGDEVMVLPSGFSSQVAGIDDRRRPARGGLPAPCRSSSASPTTSTSPAATCSVGRNNRPNVGQDVSAMVCWMAEQPLAARHQVRHQAHDPLGAGARALRSSTAWT